MECLRGGRAGDGRCQLDIELTHKDQRGHDGQCAAGDGQFNGNRRGGCDQCRVVVVADVKRGEQLTAVKAALPLRKLAVWQNEVVTPVALNPAFLLATPVEREVGGADEQVVLGVQIGNEVLHDPHRVAGRLAAGFSLQRDLQ